MSLLRILEIRWGLDGCWLEFSVDDLAFFFKEIILVTWVWKNILSDVNLLVLQCLVFLLFGSWGPPLVKLVYSSTPMFSFFHFFSFFFFFFLILNLVFWSFIFEFFIRIHIYCIFFVFNLISFVFLFALYHCSLFIMFFIEVALIIIRRLLSGLKCVVRWSWQSNK